MGCSSNAAGEVTPNRRHSAPSKIPTPMCKRTKPGFRRLRASSISDAKHQHELPTAPKAGAIPVWLGRRALAHNNGSLYGPNRLRLRRSKGRWCYQASRNGFGRCNRPASVVCGGDLFGRGVVGDNSDVVSQCRHRTRCGDQGRRCGECKDRGANPGHGQPTLSTILPERLLLPQR
jgi:hypothetical protein